jgi:hypothetical protein
MPKAFPKTYTGRWWWLNLTFSEAWRLLMRRWVRV